MHENSIACKVLIYFTPVYSKEPSMSHVFLTVLNDGIPPGKAFVYWQLLREFIHNKLDFTTAQHTLQAQLRERLINSDPPKDRLSPR
jgi:hypothetical protein